MWKTFADKYDKNKIYLKVSDHYHYTGEYRGPSHSILNLKYSIPVVYKMGVLGNFCPTPRIFLDLEVLRNFTLWDKIRLIWGYQDILGAVLSFYVSHCSNISQYIYYPQKELKHFGLEIFWIITIAKLFQIFYKIYCKTKCYKNQIRKTILSLYVSK